jgi:hypothetical protein
MKGSFAEEHQVCRVERQKEGSMKRLMKKMTVVVSVVAFCAFGFMGCEKEGPAEKAGKEIDKAFDSAKKEIDKATGH